MRHRGPDDCGVLVTSTDMDMERLVAEGGYEEVAAIARGDHHGSESNGSVGLGHTRLSLLDLTSAGRQPMLLESAGLAVSYNGEIYNYREVRLELEARGHRFVSRSDTEVLLHAYDEWDVRCLEHLVGMWAFVLWDARRQRMFAARDRLGIKPLLYTIGSGEFLCSSELRGIEALISRQPEVDPVAVHHYLSMGQVPAPLTMFRDVRKLKPGTFLVVETDSLIVEQYYQLPGPCRVDEDARGIRAAKDALEEAVHACLVADVPLGMFLSGGLDSSLVAALASEGVTAPPRAFVLSYPGIPGYDEAEWARGVGEHLGMRVRESSFGGGYLRALLQWWGYCDEPFLDPAGLGVFLLARDAVSDTKAVLTGDGGDEVFAGYGARHWELDRHIDGLVSRRLGWLRSSTTSWQPPGVRWEDEGRLTRMMRRRRSDGLTDADKRFSGYFAYVSVLSEAEKAALYTDSWSDQVEDVSTLNWLHDALPTSAASRLDRWQRLDLATTLPDQMLMKTDRATMAWGLEARVPFLDHRVVAAALALPDSLRVSGGAGKVALRSIASDLLPAGVVHRKKHGFGVPIGSWLDRSAVDSLRPWLGSEAVKRHRVFEPSAVSALVNHHLVTANDPSASAVLAIAGLHAWMDGDWRAWQ